MPPLTLYHNPNCSTSRKVLGLLQEKGLSPAVVQYLKVGWTRPQLDDLLQRMGVEPRAILRAREPLVKQLGLDDQAATPEALLEAMIAHPVLVERPILSSPKGAAVCRPIERMDALL
jgi:arsenate reductase